MIAPSISAVPALPFENVFEQSADGGRVDADVGDDQLRLVADLERGQLARSRCRPGS